LPPTATVITYNIAINPGVILSPLTFENNIDNKEIVKKITNAFISNMLTVSGITIAVVPGSAVPLVVT